MTATSSIAGFECIQTGRFSWERILRRAILSRSSTKLVGFIMATYADADGGRVRPGQERIADAMGASVSTVDRAIRELEGMGMLELIRRGHGYGRGQGVGVASEYRLTLPSDLIERVPMHDPEQNYPSPVTGAVENNPAPVTGSNSAEVELPVTGARTTQHPEQNYPAPVTAYQTKDQTKDQTKENPSSDADASDPVSAGPEKFSEDVERLCEHLAAHIKANGNNANIGIRWKQAADRLIRIDGYTPDQIRQVIDWSQQNEFWQGNILSMTKFREKFDQLKTKMLNDRARRPSGMSTSEQRITELQALKGRHLTTSENRIGKNIAALESYPTPDDPETFSWDAAIPKALPSFGMPE